MTTHLVKETTRIMSILFLIDTTLKGSWYKVVCNSNYEDHDNALCNSNSMATLFVMESMRTLDVKEKLQGPRNDACYNYKNTIILALSNWNYCLKLQGHSSQQTTLNSENHWSHDWTLSIMETRKGVTTYKWHDALDYGTREMAQQSIDKTRMVFTS